MESERSELSRIFSWVRILQSDQSEYVPRRATAKISVISPYFLVWKFCGKGQFPETVPFHKISTQEN